jgi:fermentation-respiration switch protein FrsA (DUF1100 family)
MRARFAFRSEGEALVGDLFLPERSRPLGAVVAVGPLTSVKEQAAGTYAQAMAERGYAALAFDYRGVAGVYTDGAETKAAMGAGYEAAIDRGRAAERKWRETGEAETIPAVGPDGGDVAMPLREAYEFYGTLRGQVPNYVNAYAVQSSAYTVPFDARGAADAIEVPVLIVHSEDALAPGLAHAFYAAVNAPKQELWLRSQGQIDFYDDPELVSAATDAISAFWRDNHVDR